MEEQYKLFQSWIHSNTLLCVEIVIRKIGRKTVFGRLLNFDETQQTILLYDVDNKEVHSIKINEIDHIDASED